MYRKLLIFGLVLAALLPAGGHTGAADTWQAWLYAPASGEMVLIDGSGFIQEQVTLPLPSGYRFYPFEVAVSNSGRRVAYVVTGAEASNRMLLVYDTGTRRSLLAYALPPVLADSISFRGDDTRYFNISESALAFGLRLRDGGWQVLLIDLQSGLASHILRSGMPGLDLPQGPDLTPVVRYWEGSSVVFTLVQGGDGAQMSIAGSYAWDTLSSRVEADPVYATLDDDTFYATGEVVMALPDPGSSSGRSHSVHVYDPVTAERFPIFAVDAAGLRAPRYVQGGLRVLLGIFDDAGPSGYLLLARDGRDPQSWRAGDGLIVSSLWGTAEGFAYTADSVVPGGRGSSTLYSVDLGQGLAAGQPLFTGTTGSYLRIVWLRDPRQTARSLPVWAAAALPQPQPQDTAVPQQQAGWWAWIYQSGGAAVRIDHTGALLDTVQPVHPEGTGDRSPQALPAWMTASHSGRFLAYVFTEGGRPRYLQVYDTGAGTERLTYLIPHDDSSAIASHTIDRAPYHNLFNENDTALAFGFGLGETGWQITVLNLLTGQSGAVLRHDSPAMQRLLTETDFGVVPVIQRFSGGQVAFTIQPAGPLGPPYPAFTWDILAGTVSPGLLYASVPTDTLPTSGEVVMAMIDGRLPNTAENFSYGQLNALHIHDPQEDTRYPFYNAPALWLFRPVFVENGRRVLVGGSDASGAFTGWVVLERDGSQAGVLPLAAPLWDQAGVAEGFVYIPRTDGPEFELWFVESARAIDAGTLIYSAPRTGRPQIVRACCMTETELPPWARLAAPVVVSGPAAAAAEPARLAVGAEAVVRTLGGNVLLVRTGPGPGHAVVTRLNSGTLVTLVEGPTAAGGVDWWRIRTPSGVEGWVAASADGILTLTPR